MFGSSFAIIHCRIYSSLNKVEGTKMTMVMPGSIQNAEVNLTGSTRTVIEMANCVDKSKGVNLWPEGQPGSTNNSLDRI